MSIDNDREQMKVLQELAFFKQNYEINGHSFSIFQEEYDRQTLNGVDLKVKQAKGLANDVNLITYLPENQEVVFSAGANIVTYNSHKRVYTQLHHLTGALLLLRSHTNKASNKEYIIWVETLSASELEKMRIEDKAENREKERDRALMEFNQLAGLTSPHDSVNSENYERNTKKIGSVTVHWLKIFDFGKKKLVYCCKITLNSEDKLQDVFLLDKVYNIVGYITGTLNKSNSSIFYREATFSQKEILFPELLKDYGQFSVLHTSLVTDLKFNPELGSFIFHCEAILSTLAIFEPQKLNETNAEGLMNTTIPTLQANSVAEVSDNILSTAINQTHIAILTSTTIYLYSIPDITQQFVCHLQQLQFQEVVQSDPNFIVFNRSALLLTYKNSSKLSTLKLCHKRGLQHSSTTQLQINHCKELLRLFINPYSTEMLCLVRLYELEGRVSNVIKSRKVVESSFEYVIKPAFMDVHVTYLGCSSKSEVKALGINRQKHQKILVSPWSSQFLIQTVNEIESKGWKQSFQSKRCSALHPTGLFLAVCFKDCFKIYLVTPDGLANTFRGDIMKDIHAVAISEHGHHLAVAGQTTSNNSINVYTFYNCTKVSTINLPLGVNIQRMQYQSDYLCCTLKNKKIYVYAMADVYFQVLSFSPKMILEGQNNTSAIWFDTQLQLIIFSCRKWLYFVNVATMTLLNSFDFGLVVTCIYYNSNLSALFLGTENGQIMSFRWPNKPTKLTSQHKRYHYHSGKVIDIKVTSDLTQMLSIGEDQSLYISQLSYVSGLKRLQGLQIIEGRANDNFKGEIRLSYDMLTRKGFTQYTHSLLNEKSDLVKDFEDEVLNVNFILPEERLKQKQIMLTDIERATAQLDMENKSKSTVISAGTSCIRNKVKDKREEIEQFKLDSQNNLLKLNKQFNEQYQQIYTHNARLQVRKKEMQGEFREKVKLTKAQYEQEKMDKKGEYAKKLQQLEKEFGELKVAPRKYYLEQVGLVQQQKQAFIQQNMMELANVANEIQAKNGVLLCQNGNLHKEIGAYRRKIEDTKYMIYSIENSLKLLQSERSSSDKHHDEASKLFHMDRHVTLSDIERRYVKKTKELIDLDKDISNKIVMYEKEKGILVYLEKTAEKLEEEIQLLVGNLLEEKKLAQTESDRWEEGRKLERELANKLRTKMGSKPRAENELKSLCSTIKNVINDHENDVLTWKQKLLGDCLSNQRTECQQRETLIDFGRQTAKNESQQSRDTKMIRLLTEPANRQTSPNFARLGNPLTSRSRRNMLQKKGKTAEHRYSVQPFQPQESISHKSDRIILQLKNKDKQYQRIKTEQMFFDNARRKINLQNQDLINTYNSLTYEHKELKNAMNNREKKPVFGMHRKSIKQKTKESKPTPFMLHLKKKSRPFIHAQTFTQQ